ncbi:MAG: hypothetical protein K6C36_02165, partial [Clostridia bacterium]|nr:hypothetical protein [Clostridia bacterium]
MKRTKKLAAIILAAALCVMCALCITAGAEYDEYTLIPINTVHTDNLEDWSEDFFRFDVPVAGYVQIRFDHTAFNDPGSYWAFSLYVLEDDCLEEQLYCEVPGNAASVTTAKVGVPAGTCYIEVRVGNDYSDAAYGITPLFTAADDWETEENGWFDCADEIAVNTPVNGTIWGDWADEDYFTFTAETDGVVTVDLAHAVFNDEDAFWTATLYNEEYEELARVTSTGRTASVSTPEIGVPAGVYYIGVRQEAFSDREYAVTASFTAASDWEKEVNNSFETAQEIAVNAKTNGALANGSDLDYYTFTTDSAGAVSLEFTHAVFNSEETYWSATLYNDEFTQIARVDSTGKNATVTTPQIGISEGTYYILVDPSWSYSDGTYGIKPVFTAGDDWESETNDDFDSADEIAVNVKTNGALGTDGDEDWYA